MKKVDFEHGSITSNIFQTALPMMVAQVLTLLYNIVDRIYIGRIPEVGTEALGAVGLCFPVIILITGFTNMYGMGGSPLFSMEYGRGNRSKATAILNSTFRLEIATGLIIILIGELFTVPMLHLFGATDAEVVYAAPYLHIYLIGTVFSMVSTGMNPYINAQGFATIGMVTVTIGAIANLILDPLFILALGMGVTGAAIATVISQFLSAIFVMYFLLGKRNEFPLLRQIRIPVEPAGNNSSDNYSSGNPASVDSATGISAGTPAAGISATGISATSISAAGKQSPESRIFPYAMDIAVLGLAPFIMQVTNSLVSIVCNKVLMSFGGPIYVSCMTVISSVRQILDTPVMAISNGASPTLSYNYGAGRPKRVRKAIWIMTATAMSYTLIMWIFIKLRPDLLIALFTSDKELQELAVRPLSLYFYAFIFQSFQYSGQSTFKALGKKNRAIFFSLFRKVVMVVPLTYLLPYVFGFGTDGVFIAEPVSNLIGGLACFTTMLLTILPELKRMERN